MSELHEAFRAISTYPEGSPDPEEADGAARPEPETIWAAVRGELPPEQLLAIVDRLHLDPQLALEWRLALELMHSERGEAALDSSAPADKAAAAELAAEPLPVSSPAPKAGNDRRYWGSLGVFAVAASLVGFVLLQEEDEHELRELPQLEQSDTSAVYRASPAAATITSELPPQPIARDHLELRWTPVPEATRYELQLMSGALETLYEERELVSPSALVPAASLTAVSAGSELLWQVSAVMPDGALVRSEIFSVRVD